MLSWGKKGYLDCLEIVSEGLGLNGDALVQDKLLTMDPKEITYEMVNKKLQEIVLSRGKKGIDRQDQVEMLSYLATVAKGPYQKVHLSG